MNVRNFNTFSVISFTLNCSVCMCVDECKCYVSYDMGVIVSELS